MTDKANQPAIEFACAAQTLRKAARLISKRYEEGLRGLNLSASQFSILQALSKFETLAFKTISSVLGLDSTTLSRLLKTLEKRKLVKILTDEKDGRGRIISATDEGRQLFAEAEKVWKPINKDVLSRLDEDEWQTVKTALNTLST